MTHTQHPLFKHYPLDGTVQIDEAYWPTPYHVYGGSMLFISGRANASVAQTLMQNERLAPLMDDQGNALMAVWICDFTEASLGPHHELQFSLFASFTPQSPTPSHPLAIYRQLATNPHTVMLCHGLWNNTTLVVRYNNQHLGLNAALSHSSYERSSSPERWKFRVDQVDETTASQQPLASGDIVLAEKQDARLTWQMTSHIGLRGPMRMAGSRFIHVPVVNPVSGTLKANQIAHTYTVNRHQTIRLYNPDTDQLTISHPAWAQLNFQPDTVQYASGVHFVYLRPVPPAG